MNQIACMKGEKHISTWVPGTVKERFAVIARSREISESALLRKIVEQALMLGDARETTTGTDAERALRTARLSVRLEANDCASLRRRAAERSIPAATYVSMLVRAHLRSQPPLPTLELAALRESVTELSGIGRMLSLRIRGAESACDLHRGDLEAILRACEGLRDHVRLLIHSNLESWRSGDAKANR
jgi:hypothetical protein